METLTIPTHEFNEMVDITNQVQRAVSRAALEQGAVLVYSPHTTAAIVVQEGADPNVAHDLLARLQELAPRRRPQDRHAEGNSDAHLKTALLGCSQIIPLADGRLVLGAWQSIFLAEFDGPRTRRVLLTMMPAAG